MSIATGSNPLAKLPKRKVSKTFMRVHKPPHQTRSKTLTDATTKYRFSNMTVDVGTYIQSMRGQVHRTEHKELTPTRLQEALNEDAGPDVHFTRDEAAALIRQYPKGELSIKESYSAWTGNLARGTRVDVSSNPNLKGYKTGIVDGPPQHSSLLGGEAYPILVENQPGMPPVKILVLKRYVKRI